MSTFKSSSQAPHQSFRAQTAALLVPAFGPPAVRNFLARRFKALDDHDIKRDLKRNFLCLPINDHKNQASSDNGGHCFSRFALFYFSCYQRSQKRHESENCPGTNGWLDALANCPSTKLHEKMDDL